MKAVLPLLLLAACQSSYGDEASKIVAMSDWSKPVSATNGTTLRARMIISRVHSPAHVGPEKETAVYLEFQNVTGAAGAPLKFYFDPGHAMRCDLLSADRKSPPAEVMAVSGGGAGPSWITLPYDSSIRLRANMYGYGLKPEDGLKIVMSPPNMQSWIIRSGDPQTYFMSGTFTAIKSPNLTTDTDEARTIWSGELELPKMKLSLPKK